MRWLVLTAMMMTMMMMVMMAMTMMMTMMPALTTAMLGIIRLSDGTATTTETPKGFWNYEENENGRGMDWKESEVEITADNSSAKRIKKRDLEAEDTQEPEETESVCPKTLLVFPHGRLIPSNSTSGTATLTCTPGYALNDVINTTFRRAIRTRFACQNQKWVPADGVPKKCLPECMPECPKDGRCVAPNVCHCGEGECHVTSGCPEQVDVQVENALKIVPGSIGGALGICKLGYETKPRVSEFLVPCVDGKWIQPRDEDGSLLTCRPTCFPPCLHGGTCTAPGKCTCPEGTNGHRCQYSKVDDGECGEPVASEGVELIKWSNDMYGLRCTGNEVFPGRPIGATVILACSNGSWISPEGGGSSSLVCGPFCDRPCSNGGTCIGHNECQCQPGFGGRFCHIKECPKSYPVVEHAAYSDNGKDPDSKDYRRYIQCEENWSLPSGHLGKADLHCSNGQWVVLTETQKDNENLRCVQVPCDLECQNGGHCLGEECQCPEGVEGDHCENRLCPPSLPRLENAWLDQSRFPQLVFKCLPGHTFPSGLTEDLLRCVLGSWTFEDHGTEVEDKEIEGCFPVCSKQCLNGGSCWAPDMCKCLRGFTGKQCEVVVEVENNCYYPLPQVLFAEVVSSDTQPMIQCYEGYRLPSGRTQANFKCHIHRWILEGEKGNRDDFPFACLPDCDGTCTGNEQCVAPMTCGCRFSEMGSGCEQVIEGFQCNEEDLPVVANAIVWSYDATAHCLKGYELKSGGGTHAKLECHGGNWTHAVLEEGCVPHCSFQCQNGGVCKAPEFCECQDGYYGAECQLAECEGVPPALENSDVCHEKEGKVLKCASGYVIQGGQDKVPLVCMNKAWSLPDVFCGAPACAPVCSPPCMNGGTCVAPNVCECQVGFCGTHCEGVSCDAIPTDIKKAHLKISERRLTAECPKEKNFPLGETKLHFHCFHNCWYYPHPYRQGDSIECQAMCHPPCLNGGTCTGRDVCSCAKGFHGQRCEQKACEGPLPFVEGDIEFFESKVHVTCLTSAGPATSYWIECQEGSWIIDDPEKHSLCHPNCPSPCENGGTCTPNGTCLCPLGFRGTACEERERFSKCKQPPASVDFGDIVHAYEEGILRCHENYMLSNNKSWTRLVCQNDQWLYPDFPGETEVKCQPQCPEQCLNGGICVAFQTCKCHKGFSGAQCQNYTFCDDPPLVPPNMVAKFRNATSYTAKCSPGFTWNDLLSPGLLITCESGVWVKSHRHFCVPSCPNGCLNGGTCVAPNECQCQEFFEGEQCQTLKWGSCSGQVLWENVMVSRSSEGLQLRCKKNHNFPWTSAPVVTLSCFHGNGSWLTPAGWSWALDPCVPECQPQCHGGGTCISPDHCLCPNGVSSSQCLPQRGCLRMPEVANATSEVISLHIAKVTCRPGHATDQGLKSFFMRCRHDLWFQVGQNNSSTEDQVSCQHQCQAPCLNGGSCVAPEKCHCPPGFAGERCQYHACGTVPLIIHRARVEIRGKAAAIACLPGHRLPSGRAATSARCRKSGGWRFPAELAGHMSVSCMPYCSLPCLNRGRCVAPEECLCAEGFFGVQCEQRYSETVDGRECHFPFLHEGHWHYSCTMEGSSLPWCATAVNEQNLVIQWAVCVAAVGETKVVRTVCGKTCQFPFQHEDEEHGNCIITQDSCHPTCPTEVDAVGNPTEWGVCNADQGLREIVLTVRGKKCVFPFLYKKEWLSVCVEGLQGPWCPTSLTEHGEPMDKDTCWWDKGYQRVEVTEEGRPCVFPFAYKGTRHYTCMGSGDAWCATEVGENLRPLAWGMCAGQGECTDTVCLEHEHHDKEILHHGETMATPA